MRVESSLVQSVWTEILRLSPLSSDTGSSYTIKPSRLMGAVNFLNFVQPQSLREDFYFLWHGMTSYSTSCFGGNFCILFAQFWMWICVRLRILHTFMDFPHVVYGVCARCADFTYVYRLCILIRRLHTLCGFCICIRILCSFCGFCVRIRLLSSQCSIWTVSRYPILRAQ